jgi:virulence-associated protein VagC
MMDTITLKGKKPDEDMRIAVAGDRLLIAPVQRPGDWREVPMGALNTWAVKHFREAALQPVAKLGEEDAG